MRDQKWAIILVLLSLAWLTSACGEIATGNAATQTGVYPVDPLFQEFYQRSGGEPLLGPANSPLFVYGTTSYQYVSAGLMAHDPDRADGESHYFAAIGLDLGIREPPVTPPERAEEVYRNGHIIYADFVNLYEQLGGETVIGLPLSEAHANPDKSRIEQYFENMGFYRLEGDSSERVKLLAYGDWSCDQGCAFTPPDEAEIVPYPPTGPEFVEAVARLGPDFTGFPLSEVYNNPDGLREQIFGNLVLTLAPNGGPVQLRSVASELGFSSTNLTLPGNDPDLVFFLVNDQGGFNVPRNFLDYLAKHGGLDASGMPLSELIPVGEGLYQQCFTNLCLRGQRTDQGELRVKPMPLGYQYRDAKDYFPASVVENESGIGGRPTPYRTAEGISLQIWETQPAVTQSEGQEIVVNVLQDNLPLRGVNLKLFVNPPGSSERAYAMPPTGEDGTSKASVEPIQMPNGTLIPYRVCLQGALGENPCAGDSYLIWGD